jgi:lipid-A-disaccharide synthase
VDATFVGHPLADLPAPSVTREAYAAEFGLDAAKPWITLMPGSRRKEVRMILPTMLEAVRQLGSAYEFVLPVARTLEAAFVRTLIEAQESAMDGRGKREGPRIRLVPDALPSLYHARAAIVASGTATVEAAIMGTPFTMVYRVSPLTYALGKPRVKVPYYAMVNLIAGEQIVPELVQDKFTAGNVVEEMQRILPDGEARTRMIAGLARVKARLKQGSGGGHPSEKAAGIIGEMLGQIRRG